MTASVVVEQCDPRVRAAEILDLFARHEQSQFEAAFDRAYRTRAGHGLRSWLGTLDGETVMHVSVSPIRFRRGDQTLVAGVMGDLLVAEAQRDFWAPVRLLRQVVADLKREGEVDFLLTTTTSDAETVFKAGGFKPYGHLRRYVLPLNRAYLQLARLRSRAPRMRAESEAAMPTDPATLALGAADLWRPEARSEFYETRFAREEYLDQNWLRVSSDDGTPAPRVLLCRMRGMPEIGFADAIWSGRTDSLAGPILGAAGWARANRFPRMVATALHESRATGALVRAGFVPRGVRSSLLVNNLRTAPPAEDILLTGFSLSSW